MLRSIALALVVACSFAVAFSQTPAPNSGKATDAPRVQTQRDMPFPGGVNLPFLLKELARDIDLNILFDPESRLEMRTARLELRNVTGAEAINAILLQEGLVYEQAGPKTILVSSRLRGTSLPQIGVGTMQLTSQLSEFFGVKGGTLITQVNPNSASATAGLKAGDVIVELDGTAVQGALGLYRALNEKIGTEVSLTIVRERKPKTISITPQRGF